MKSPWQRDPFAEIHRQQKLMEEMRKRNERLRKEQQRQIDRWRKQRERLYAWQQYQRDEQRRRQRKPPWARQGRQPGQPWPPPRELQLQGAGPVPQPSSPSLIARLLRFIVILVGLAIALGVLFVFALALMELLS